MKDLLEEHLKLGGITPEQDNLQVLSNWKNI